MRVAQVLPQHPRVPSLGVLAMGGAGETSWSRFSEARTSDDNDLGSGQDLASAGMTEASKLKRDYHHGKPVRASDTRTN